jgi:hypothetical protein
MYDDCYGHMYSAVHPLSISNTYVIRVKTKIPFRFYRKHFHGTLFHIFMKTACENLLKKRDISRKTSRNVENFREN